MTNKQHLVALAQKHPPLTDEQEKELAVLSLAGDIEARDTLINHNILYAMKLSAKWWVDPLYREYRDEIDGAAMLGLCEATKKYDGRIRFASWAWFNIMNSIGNCCKDFACGHSVPRQTLRYFPVVRDAYIEIKLEGQEPTIEELVERIGKGPKSKYWVEPCMHVLNGQSKSLDASLGEGGTGTLHDIVEVEAIKTDATAEANSSIALLNKAIAMLSDHEAYCLCQRHGIGTPNGDERLIADIATELGLSTQAVSRTVKTAIEKLNGTCVFLNYKPGEFKFLREAMGTIHE